MAPVSSRAAAPSKRQRPSASTRATTAGATSASARHRVESISALRRSRSSRNSADAGEAGRHAAGEHEHLEAEQRLRGAEAVLGRGPEEHRAAGQGEGRPGEVPLDDERAERDEGQRQQHELDRLDAVRPDDERGREDDDAGLGDHLQPAPARHPQRQRATGGDGGGEQHERRGQRDDGRGVTDDGRRPGPGRPARGDRALGERTDERGPGRRHDDAAHEEGRQCREGRVDPGTDPAAQHLRGGGVDEGRRDVGEQDRWPGPTCSPRRPRAARPRRGPGGRRARPSSPRRRGSRT